MAALAGLTRARKLALAWLAVVLLTAVLAGLLPLPYAPGTPDLGQVSQPPFGPGRHWLGTDPQGRDVLSVLVFGARTAVLLTLPAAVLAAAFGALVGGAAGFWGNGLRLSVPGWLLVAGGAWWALQLPVPAAGLGAVVVAGAASSMARLFRWRLPAWPVPISAVVMGVATTLDSIPRLILVVAMAAGAGISTPGLLALLTLTAWPHPARLVRAQMLRVRTLPFVEAARAAGLPAGRIWWRHALPHALHPLRAALPLSLAGLLGLESTLSFLGIGLPPDTASWGRLLGTIREDSGAWWTLIFPGLLLIATLLSLNQLGNPRRQP